jgi:hypothetical protein
MDLSAHRVGADEQPPLDQAKSVDAGLSVVASIVHDLPDAVFENDYPKGERHAVLGQIDASFSGSCSTSMPAYTAKPYDNQAGVVMITAAATYADPAGLRR